MSTQTVVDLPSRSETQEACVAVKEAPYSIPQQSPISDHKSYAGFWRRLVAFLIDYVITAVPSWIGITILSVAMGETGYLFGCVLGTIGCWLYYALFESSSKQATLGKLALGIKVTDLNGLRASFAKATGRHFAKILSGLILGIGYIMAGFTTKKQALHDQVAGCLVVQQ